MNKKILMLLWGIILLATHVAAQQISVTGRVTSLQDGQPIPGVSVKIKGSQTGAQTSVAGSYSIKAKKGDILVYSYIGMLEQEKTVGENTIINVALAENNNALNEVVVTAMGITRNKKALGYSAQTLQGSDIAQTQRDNFLNALQGRVAGATITPTTGTPGASSTMIIRGAVSLDGDNQPLFVVDGLPISNRTFSEYNLVGQGSFNRQNDYGNRAMDINPEEIESITILKGPEASALYGTEGASGAVIITTKKAKAGVARVNYSNSFRIEQTYRYPEVQTVYAGGAGGIFDEEQRTRTYFGSKYPANKTLYNNIANFYKTGFTQKHNASIEGGSEKLSFRTGVSYTNQTGVVPGTGYVNFNGKISGASKISEKISMNASLNLISSKTDKTYKGVSSPMLSALSWPRTDDMRNYLTPAGERRILGTSFGGELDNPYWGVDRNPNWDKMNRVLGNIVIDYKPAEWLFMSARAGADIFSQVGLSAYDIQSYEANKSATTNSGGGLNTYNANERLINASFIATAKKDFGKFKPILRIGGDIKDDSYQVNSQFGTRFYQANFFSMNNVDPTTQRVAYTDELKRKVGFFASAEFGYDNYLYLTLTGRQDMSSTLPQKNYSFFYPATSLSFVFSELPAFKKMNWLSFGKLRASWGQSGKDARVAYITSNKLIAQTTTGGGYAMDTTAGNPDLEAEFTTSKEIGMEMGFFNNRLSFDFSYYQQLSDKQIVAPRLSYASGSVLQYINSGKIRHRGFELMVKGNPVKTKNFSWDISANVARVKGYILSLPANQDAFYVSDTWLYDNVRAQYSLGGSVSSFAGIDFLRNKDGQLLINPTNGMPIKDVNFTPMGDRAPSVTMGLTNSFTYKNFNLSFLLDIRKGGDIYNATELYLYARGLSKLSLDREVPRVIQGVLRDGLENSANPTKNNIVVIPYITTSYYSTYYNTADFLQKNVNWIRLKDITLSYNLPKSVFANSRVIKNMNVFFTGTDLLLITNYKGVDPSVNGLSAASGGLGGTGIDFGSVGLPRGYNLGVRIGF
ncbi:SusC/RagA family TonB-linked outer membrane protein [Pedobacter nutrimenti]|jgi:TonB-linked SusC/RagA family outer membrane protein|uniref:TonB-linked SusC/RagA family outer membrane protein n=1 Tax=Pedobacter nutrimenti TaxID=1241337 RepID=A0A318UJ57_9SPHI|nr:SusC/RagA family TonB-linked outer membrane protein [Pedobacter nutrimenti]PYF75610.1 TonB-linked SusC/RagA family outer membrane protein [Pedobacter nutrimenti]